MPRRRWLTLCHTRLDLIPEALVLLPSRSPVPSPKRLAAPIAGSVTDSCSRHWQLLSSFGHTVSRRLYLTSAAAAAALRTPGLRVLYAGVKVFERDGSLGVGCPYRVVQEGALLLWPYLGHRALTLSPEAFGALVRARSLPLQLPPGLLSESPAAPTPVGTAEGGAEGGTDDAVEAGETVDKRPHKSAAQPLHGDEALLAPLIVQLAALSPNGCCVLSCANAAGSARMAVCAMKYTDKAVVFISEG